MDLFLGLIGFAILSPIYLAVAFMFIDETYIEPYENEGDD